MSETQMRKPQPLRKPIRGPVRGKDTVTILREVLRGQGADDRMLEKFFSDLAQTVQAGLVKPIQIGNTVFLAQHFTSNAQMLPKGEVEIHMFSAEPFSETAKRMMVLPNTLRELGYQKFTTFVQDKAMANLLLQMQKKIGVQGTLRQDVQMIGRRMQPVYRAEALL